MKNKERITIALTLAAAVLAFMSGAGMVSAQTTTLTCLPATSTIAPNQSVTFFATGGTGTYAFSGGNILATTTTAGTFTTSFPTSGINTFLVTSGGQSANCSVNVQPTTSGAVACIPPTTNVTAGIPATFTATGGNGNFLWSASDLTISNPAGSSFSATYTSAGFHTLTVTSNGQSSSCTFNVSPAQAGALSCAPSVSTVNAGTPVVYTATGGNGTYTWSATDLTISNPNGSGFTANYAATGMHSVTVTSGGQSATCSVTVLPVSIPGLPNTGFAPVN